MRILLILLILSSTYCFSQKCKYETNEFNKETNLPVKITKKIKVFDTFATIGGIGFNKINDSYSLDYCYSVMSSKCATSYEGCEMTLLLENGKEINLSKGKLYYDISNEQILSMLKYKVVKISYQYGDNPTNTKYTENKIASKKAEKIVKLIRCVY